MIRAATLKPILAVAIFLAPCLGGRTAAASGGDDRFQQALTYYQQADFIKSIAELEAARKEATSADLLGKIELYLGINYTVLSKLELAKNAFKEALIHTPTLIIDSKRHKALVAATFFEVKASMKGRLVIVGVTDAAVFVDGKQVGTTPFNDGVSVGVHRLKVLSQDGKSQFRQQVLIQYNEETKVNAMLTPIKGWLNLNSEPSGAAVLLDGKEIGKTPLKSHPMNAGKYRLVVQLNDARKKSVDVVIPPLAETSMEVQLPDLTAVATKPISPADKAADPNATQDATDGQASGKRLWTWVSLGGTLAVAAVGIGLGAAANSDNSAWKREGDPQRAQDLLDSGQGKQLGANICYGLAGALAVTSVVLFFLEGRSPSPAKEAMRKRARSAKVLPVFGSTTGLALEGRF